MKNPRVSRRKEILKLMAEINAKETKVIIGIGVAFQAPSGSQASS